MITKLLAYSQHLLHSPYPSIKRSPSARHSCPSLGRVDFSTTSSLVKPIPSMKEMLKELDLLIYDRNVAIKSSLTQGVQKKISMLEFRQALRQEKKLIFKQLGSVLTSLEVDAQKTNRILAITNITAQELTQEFMNIMRILEELTDNDQSFELNQLVQKQHFLRSIRNYLTQKTDLNSPQKQFTESFKAAFIVEACCKIRDLLHFFKEFNTPPSIINSPPDQYAKVWQRIELVRLTNEGDINEQYHKYQMFIHCIGGACMMTDAHSNIFIQQLRYSFSFLKTTLNFNTGLLKNVEMYYRSKFDKIVMKVNLVEEGAFRTAYQASLAKIKTNFMIYVPHDEAEDSKCNIFTKNQDAIPVRVLHHQELPRGAAGDSSVKAMQDVIVHIHGGGYVALTSSGAQGFTRVWANQTKIPIFSIDYKLAPAHPFPRAIYDCLRVYQFITKHIHKHFNIQPQNIFVLGDSAGGSIACSMIALILKQGFKVPLGLLLVYPNLDARMMFYGSRKYILNQPLLWPSIIKLAYERYFPKGHDHANPLASPLLLTQEFVGGQQGDSRFPLRWPRTYLHVGSRDTLRDQCLIFTQRLIESGIDCKCYVINKLRHAYLGSGSMVPSAKGVIDHSAAVVKQLIEVSKKDV